MENRLLLAFVLSLAVFVGWGYFLAEVQGPMPVQEQGMDNQNAQSIPSQSTGITGSTPSAPSQYQSSQSITPTPSPVNPFPGEEVLIQVSAGKTHFTISNRGGVLKQLQLPRFKKTSENDNDSASSSIVHLRNSSKNLQWL